MQKPNTSCFIKWHNANYTEKIEVVRIQKFPFNWLKKIEAWSVSFGCYTYSDDSAVIMFPVQNTSHILCENCEQPSAKLSHSREDPGTAFPVYPYANFNTSLWIFLVFIQKLHLQHLSLFLFPFFPGKSVTICAHNYQHNANVWLLSCHNTSNSRRMTYGLPQEMALIHSLQSKQTNPNYRLRCRGEIWFCLALGGKKREREKFHFYSEGLGDWGANKTEKNNEEMEIGNLSKAGFGFLSQMIV